LNSSLWFKNGPYYSLPIEKCNIELFPESLTQIPFGSGASPTGKPNPSLPEEHCPQTRAI